MEQRSSLQQSKAPVAPVSAGTSLSSCLLQGMKLPNQACQQELPNFQLRAALQKVTSGPFVLSPNFKHLHRVSAIYGLRMRAAPNASSASWRSDQRSQIFGVFEACARVWFATIGGPRTHPQVLLSVPVTPVSFSCPLFLSLDLQSFQSS